MGFFFVDPETYEKYKDQVLALSHAVQVDFQEHLPPDARHPALSDAEIGRRLGLDERVVREIRCVAERDRYGVEEFEVAADFKDRACREWARSGMSSVMKPYVDKTRK